MEVNGPPQPLQDAPKNGELHKVCATAYPPVRIPAITQIFLEAMRMTSVKKYCLMLSLLASGILAVASMAGCQNQTGVFSDSYRESEQKGRFWDGESAVETTQSRKQSMQMPFGFPQGAADQ